MRIFIYEYACAQPPDAAIPQSVRVEGRAMRDALAADFAPLPGVEVLTLECQPRDTELRAFWELAASAAWTIVIAPEFDGLLLERCRWVFKAGGRLLGPSPEIVELAGDKWATRELLMRNHVRTPQTWLAETFSARGVSEGTARMTCVRKPRYGAGSLEVKLTHRGAAGESRPGFLVQQFIPGLPASLAFLTGPSQIIPLLPGEQLLSNDGTFRYLGGRVPLPPHLAERAIALATAAIRCLPGPLGYLGVDLVLGEAADGRADFVIEINPRLTTSYIGLRALTHDNLADLMLRLGAGVPVPAVTWQPRRIHFTPDGRIG
jgi:hypothetical protein